MNTDDNETLVLYVYGINKSNKVYFCVNMNLVFEHVGMSYSERTKETENYIL